MHTHTDSNNVTESSTDKILRLTFHRAEFEGKPHGWGPAARASAMAARIRNSARRSLLAPTRPPAQSKYTGHTLQPHNTGRPTYAPRNTAPPKPAEVREMSPAEFGHHALTTATAAATGSVALHNSSEQTIHVLPQHLPATVAALHKAGFQTTPAAPFSHPSYDIPTRSVVMKERHGVHYTYPGRK